MPGKKHKPVKSKAQARLLFAKENAGELEPGEAKGKLKAAGGMKGLPNKVKRKKK